MKKLLSLVLVFAMVFALCTPAFAEKSDETYNYVSFGASNTNGYGLHGYLRDPFYEFIGTSEQIEDWNANKWNASAWDPSHMMEISLCGYRRAPEGCYPDLIRDSLVADGKNVQFDQFAMSSMRVEELRVLLDDTYEGDDFTKWRFYDPSYPYLAYDMEGGVGVMREYVQNAVQNADLITYDMGANNFGVYLSLRLMNGLFDNDFADIYGEEAAAKFYELRSKVESKVIAMFGGILSEDTFITLDDLSDTLSYALLGYCYNFDKTMGIITQLNPNAQIVVLSIQNNISDLEASIGGVKLPLGELFSSIADIANIYMTSISEYKDKYVYADVRQNGHVELFFNEIKNYNGDPYSLDQSILDCFNCLDNNLHLQTDVTKMLEEKGILPGSEAYEKALYSAYDAMATMMKAGANVEVMPLDGILGGIDTGNIEDNLLSFIQKTYLDAACAAINTPDVPYDVEAAANELLEDDNYKAVTLLGIRTSIGNSFYAHPNYNGHIQLRNAVLKALEENTSGNEALAEAIFRLKDHLIELGLTYGIEGVKLVTEKLFSLFDLEEFAEKITSFVSTDDLVEYLLSVLDLDSNDKVQLAESCIDEAEEELSAHKHRLALVFGKAATCTQTGVSSHWECSCGQMFGNISGTAVIDDASQLVIPAKGHSLTYIPARNATLFSAGNTAYYVCSVCGKLYSDAKGINEITYASTVVQSKTSSALSKLFK